MSERLDWATDGERWPHREHSRFIRAAGLQWHVQVLGRGPTILLVHGTGSSTHSWRDSASALAKDFTVVMVDLPGHAFSTLPADGQFSLKGMANALGILLKAMQISPDLVVGHSAGAAILLTMILDGAIAPRAAVSFCGALLPFTGIAEFAFPVMAKVLFLNPFAAPLASRMTRTPGAVDQLIRRTGSQLDDEGLRYYRLLLRNSSHVAATLGMMANWDLRALKRDLPKLNVSLTLISASNDLAVPADVGEQVKRIVPKAQAFLLPGQGHLVHEVAPDVAVSFIRKAMASVR